MEPAAQLAADVKDAINRAADAGVDPGVIVPIVGDATQQAVNALPVLEQE